MANPTSANCGCSTRPSAMPTLPVCLWRNKFDRKGRRRVLLGPRAFLWVGCHRCRRSARSRRPVESDHLSQGSKRGVSHFGCLRRPVRTQARRRGAATVWAFRIASYRRGPLATWALQASWRPSLVPRWWSVPSGQLPSLRRRWPPALPNGSGLAKEAHAGTVSGGFRVFVGGLHSRMGTVWGSGDKGPGLPPCGHHILLIVGFPTSILFSAAIVWLGFALLTGGAESAEQPSRV